MDLSAEVSTSVTVLPTQDDKDLKVSVSIDESVPTGSNVSQMTNIAACQKAWEWISRFKIAIDAVDKTHPKDIDPYSKPEMLKWMLENTSNGQMDLYERSIIFCISECEQALIDMKKMAHVIKSQHRSIKSKSPEKLLAKLNKKKIKQEAKVEEKVDDDDSDWQDDPDELAVQHKSEREMSKKRKRESEKPNTKVKEIKEPVKKKRRVDDEEIKKFIKHRDKVLEEKKKNVLPKLQCPFIVSTLRSNYKAPFNLIVLEYGLNEQDKTVQRSISEKRQRQSKPLYQKVKRCAFIGDHQPTFLREDFIAEFKLSRKERRILLQYWASDLTGIIPKNQMFKTESTCIAHNFMGPSAFSLITSKSSCNVNRGYYVSYAKDHSGLIIAQSTATDGKTDWDPYKRTYDELIKPADKLDVIKAKQLIEKYKLHADFRKDCQRSPLERVYKQITPADQRGAGAPGDPDTPGLGTWDDAMATIPRKYISADKARKVSKTEKKSLPAVMPSINLSMMRPRTGFGLGQEPATGSGMISPLDSIGIYNSGPLMRPLGEYNPTFNALGPPMPQIAQMPQMSQHSPQTQESMFSQCNFQPLPSLDSGWK